MRGGKRGHVENFAVGGQTAGEAVAVPGGEPLSTVMRVFLRNVDPPSHRIGLADPVGPAAFRHRLAEGDDPGAARNSVFWINPAEFARGAAIGQHQACTRGHYSACSTSNSS